MIMALFSQLVDLFYSEQFCFYRQAACGSKTLTRKREIVRESGSARLVTNTFGGLLGVLECMMTDYLIQSHSTLQEHCCSGGYSACAQAVAEAHVAIVGWILCLLPRSVGHLTNQPEEIWTMGRWVGQFPCFYSTVDLIPMFPFHPSFQW